MYIIGLTGNFGTGKTTVAGILSNLGAVVISADEIGHRTLESDQQILSELVAAFGSGILNNDGRIDRRKLGEIAFKSQKGTDRLNSILHALLKQKIIDAIEKCRSNGVEILVLESALLPRAEWKKLINEFWITTLPQNIIIERMQKLRKYGENEVQDRIKRQISPGGMLKQADIVINTDCSPDELRAAVGLLWKNLLKRIRHKNSSI